MDNTIIVALIGLAGSGLGAFGGVMASARLTQYRLKKLEEKVDRHNSVIERTYRLEGRMTEAEHDIRDLKERR
jgi:hypothetical protein